MCSAFKISAIKEFFYHSEFGIRKLQKNISNFPEFGNVAEIRNAFPNSETFPNSEISRSDFESAVCECSSLRLI